MSNENVRAVTAALLGYEWRKFNSTRGKGFILTKDHRGLAEIFPATKHGKTEWHLLSRVVAIPVLQRRHKTKARAMEAAQKAFSL